MKKDNELVLSTLDLERFRHLVEKYGIRQDHSEAEHGQSHCAPTARLALNGAR